MTLIATFIITLVSYFVLDKLVIPYTLKVNFTTRFAELTKIGWLSALSFIRKFCLIAAFTYGGLWLLLAFASVIGYLFKGSGTIINGVLSLLIGINRFTESAVENKTWLYLSLLGIILLIISVVNARKYAYKIYEKLKEDQKAGHLPQMPPSDQINKINKDISDVIEKFEQVRSINDTSLNAADLQKKYTYLEALRQYVSAMFANLDETDVRRRIIPEIESQSRVQIPSKNWKEKLVQFFTSQGLVNTISKSGGFVTNIGIFILLVSFVAGNGKAISNNTLAASQNVYEWHLAVEKSKLNEEWQKNLIDSRSTGPQTWTEEDENTLNEIARNVELGFADVFSPQDSEDSSTQSVSFASYRFRANAVRYQIMKEYARLPDGRLRTGFNVFKQGANLPNNGDQLSKSKKWSNTYADNVISNEPTTDLGKKIKESIRNKIKQTPHSYWTGVKDKWKVSAAAYGKTAKPSEIIGLMVGESWNGIFNGTLESGSLEGNVAKELMGKTGKSAFKSWVEYKIDNFTYNLFTTDPANALYDLKSPGSAASQFMKYSTEDIDFPTMKQNSDNLANYEPFMDFDDLGKVESEHARSALTKFSQAANVETRTVAEAISDFGFHFPGQAGMENASIAAQMNNGYFSPESYGGDGVSGGGGSGGGGSGGGGSGGGSSSGGSNNDDGSNRRSRGSGQSSSGSYAGGNSGSNTHSMASSRARSYSSLRGFRRIGGVLIGRSASNTGESGADFNDISWEETENNSLEIFLQQTNGKKISAGIYPKSIIPQTMAYVADGRLITATMIKAQPFPYLKIFTHPALTNTPTGCNAIGLDRLVDKYAAGKENTSITHALYSFKFQNYLYQYAAIQMIYNLTGTKLADKSLLEARLDEIKYYLGVSWSKGYPLMERGEVLNNSIKSHIAAKPGNYNADVVKHIQTCLAECNGSLSAFLTRMESKNVAFTNISDLLKVQTEEWSGVREVDYKVDANLEFLKPQAGQNANLFPLNFIRQIVYVPNETGENSGPEESDDNPWEFPELASTGEIERMVWNGIQTNEKDYQTFAHIKSFTLLQRLLRSAFNGDLGLNFPIEKLYYLEKLTKPFLSTIETPTWNVNMSKEYEAQTIRARYSQNAIEAYNEAREALGINLLKNQRPCN